MTVLIGIGAFLALSFALALLFGRAGKPSARMQPRPRNKTPRSPR